MGIYALYGLVFRSEIPLPGAERMVEGGDTGPCITISRGEPRAIPAAPPEGQLLLEEKHEDGGGCAYVRTPQGYCLRFYPYAEFLISDDLDHVRAHIGAGEDPEGLTIYLAGHVAAFLLARKGYTVLHASAVALRQRLVLILGHRGYGKSTLAAALCKEGYELFTDDLLPMTLTAGGVVAHRGAHTLRLRPHSAGSLALPGPLTPSCDGRLLHRPVFAGSDSMAPDAIVCLKPQANGSRTRTRRLGPLDAFGELMAHSRDTTLTTPEAMRADLAVRAAAVRSVPCHQLHVNWRRAPLPEVAAAVAGLL